MNCRQREILLLLNYGLIVQIVIAGDQQYVNYTVENAVAYNGDSSTGTDPLCDQVGFMEGEVLECEPGSKIDDNDKGPMNFVPGETDLGRYFFAFSRQSATGPGPGGGLQFNLPAVYSGMISVIIHFLNYPQASVGLPDLSIKNSNMQTVPYVFRDNHDLQPTDATVRNVTLEGMLPSPTNTLMISITFTNNNDIDWLLVSEVDIYNESLHMLEGAPVSVITVGPNDLQSSIGFSCTVINAGSFEWRWELNGEELTISDDTRYRVWLADATRSSQLEIYQLRHSDNGNYSCVVRHKGSSMYYRRVFQLTLIAILEAESETVTFPIGSTATLVCQAYGYLPGDIEWTRNGELIEAVGNYSLSMSTGNIDSIGTNGELQKSLMKSVQIRELNKADGGQYVCSLGDLSVNLTLVIGDPLLEETPTDTVNCIPSDVLAIHVVINALTGLTLTFINIMYNEYSRRKVALALKIPKHREKACQFDEIDFKHTELVANKHLRFRRTSLMLPIRNESKLVEIVEADSKSLNFVDNLTEADVNFLEVKN